MTDTVTTVTDVISGRTTQVIAAEINLIKYQAERIYLAAAVEIGRRLTEAKALLKYGEWGKWLEESVDFSQSRANKLMRIFKEYGAGLLTSSNSDPDPNLNYSQAVLLLGPAGERGPPGNSGRPKRYHHRADYGACQSEGPIGERQDVQSGTR